MHLGRLTLLALVLIAASFYAGPLRQFFVQQDRYQAQKTELESAQAENAELKARVELLNSEAYIGQQALAGSRLAPPDTQVFVIRGLPGEAEAEVARVGPEESHESFSVLDRLEDLWRTLFR